MPWLIAVIVLLAGLFIFWRGRVMNKHALELVANALYEWAPGATNEEKAARVVSIASRVLHSQPFTEEEYDWLKSRANYALQKRWQAFQECCLKQKQIRDKIERALAGRLGSMTAEQIDQLYAQRMTADENVKTTKDAFWNLHAAVGLVHLPTWPEGGAYMILAVTSHGEVSHA